MHEWTFDAPDQDMGLDWLISLGAIGVYLLHSGERLFLNHLQAILYIYAKIVEKVAEG